jgi:uncharacterized membrane protein YgcG
MPAWEIVALVVIGIPVLLAAIRFGFIGLLLDIAFAVLGGSSSSSGGGSSFGGGSFGGGGSSSSDD